MPASASHSTSMMRPSRAMARASRPYCRERSMSVVALNARHSHASASLHRAEPVRTPNLEARGKSINGPRVAGLPAQHHAHVDLRNGGRRVVAGCPIKFECLVEMPQCLIGAAELGADDVEVVLQ
jgi:hypothetical protein